MLQLPGALVWPVGVQRAELASVPLPAAQVPEEYKKPGKDWVKGPVKWLMTKEEIKDYKKLKDDAERTAFVEKFWAERDPTPDTPMNEYEIEFWLRVEQAEQNFTSQTTRHAGSDLGLERLLAIISPHNEPSISLIRKLGFEFERMHTLQGADKEACIYIKLLKNKE